MKLAPPPVLETDVGRSQKNRGPMFWASLRAEAGPFLCTQPLGALGGRQGFEPIPSLLLDGLMPSHWGEGFRDTTAPPAPSLPQPQGGAREARCSHKSNACLRSTYLEPC